MTPAARLTVRGIEAYRRHLSPRKHGACAHRLAHGGDSCSGAVEGYVRRRGVVRSVVPTVVRFAACAQAFRLLQAGDVRGVCCCGGIPIPFRF
ncbi:membrane protein insertion efficiency factor YidD [Cellulomonas marina]|uniref:Haemolytic domain-containing protein n=1 Tax=Cellulomonas marina TaxID=988821 RepID=A0A1I0W4R5_9CELL|nr:membrane protein insertion efficiency factor YidD [Cellulomonas marina]GIG29991.1 hypothetical protein Cma02nite_25910 [Cellulomonas marina]SFA83564.1 Haemolytic domain-containing protein [Cellulomonas marina]